MNFLQRRLYLAVILTLSLSANTVQGAFLDRENAVQQALTWMAENPVMSQSMREIAEVYTFPESGDYMLYVVRLAPQGYLILNSDDRLPLTVSFSSESHVNLDDDPQNALRTMLLDYCKRTKDRLDSWSPVGQAEKKTLKKQGQANELYGPFIETTWNQANPYNQLCPLAPGGSQYYNFHAPVGCVPTAYAQILNFHRWPYRGAGFHSYTDNHGSIMGFHQADFTTPYSWSLMADSYDPWNIAPYPANNAVAELMYELGVAAEIDYESNGSSADPFFLGQQLSQHFFYETVTNHANQGSLIAPMEADLRAGFPCVVSIPGHAIIADGLLVNNGEKTYHINYGWGGENNGWFSKGGIPGGVLVDGITSIRPLLKAFPMKTKVSASPSGTVELEWIIPKRRTGEVAQLEIFSLTKQPGKWSSDGSEIVGDNSGWETAAGGRTGSCWYAEKSAAHNGPASLVLDSVFVPDKSTKLSFWQFARLYLASFTIEVSTDDEKSYHQIYTASSGTEIYENIWSHHSVSLAAYSGKRITIRFLVSGSGWWDEEWSGVRLDDLQITGGKWYDWTSFGEDSPLTLRQPGEVDATLAGQPVYYTKLTSLSSGKYTLAARLTDTKNVVHGFSPAFTLIVGSGVTPPEPGDGPTKSIIPVLELLLE